MTTVPKARPLLKYDRLKSDQ